MTSPVIGVIEYGMGNIQSVMNALDEIGASGRLVSNPEDVAGCDKIILPGVGAFGEAMDNLSASGMSSALSEFVSSGRDLLVICLGMQLICASSDEHGHHQGFNWIPAEVRCFPQTEGLKIPHMGWNTARVIRPDPLFTGLQDEFDVYFVHSYRVDGQFSDYALCMTSYGDDFVSIIRHRNVIGMQFHPEKSQAAGLMLLRNFSGPDSHA